MEEFRTDTSLVKDKEMELAVTLIETLAAPFEPENYRDAYRENLLAMIEAKVQGREVVEAPAPQAGMVIDMLDALRQSLAVAKKPAAKATSISAAAEQSAAKGRGKRRAASG